MCVRVCMYVCVYMCVCMCLCVYIYDCVCVSVYVCVYIYMYMCMGVSSNKHKNSTHIWARPMHSHTQNNPIHTLDMPHILPV